MGQEKAAFQRVLIKLSGEALSGGLGTGLDFSLIGEVCEQIARCVRMGVQVSLVIGGGNFWRGVKDGAGKVSRVNADRMGMLATAMNCVAVADVLNGMGLEARVQTAVEIGGVGERYDTAAALRHLQAGRVVLYACGTGCPFFSTDTAAVLRASETECQVILLAKNVDGVYSADPKTDPSAVKYSHISYEDVLAQRLGVMDLTATSLAMSNHIPLFVFSLNPPSHLLQAVMGENVGTSVS